MSFSECINAHAMKGFLTKAQAKELLDMYEGMLSRFSETLGDEAAAHAAAEHFVKIREQIMLKELSNDMEFVKGLKKIRSDISTTKGFIKSEKAKSARGTQWAYGDPLTRAMLSKLDEAHIRGQSLANMTFAKMGEAVEAFRSKMGGFTQNTADFLDVVREIGGESTGNDIAAAAGKSMKEAMDWLHGLYSKSGGIIGKLDDWIAPHVHSPELISRVSFEEWSQKLLPLLDRERMIDYDTALPMSQSELISQMKEDYKAIVSHGLAEVAEKAGKGGQKLGGTSLAKRRMESRFYHFKSVEDFLNYNREFGLGDEGLFGAYMSHIQKMARDTGVMQVLTPKPDSVMRNLELEMIGANTKRHQQNFVKGAYNVLSGKIDAHGDLPMWYKIFNNWLHVKRAAYLTSAPISAMSDSFFGVAAAKMNGLEGTKIMGRYLSLLNPLDAESREIARVSFHAASAASGSSLSAARISDDLGRGGIFPFLSGATNRLSGLAQMTDAMKQSFHMESAGFLSRLQDAKAKWGTLDPAFRDSLSSAGISEQDFQAIMKADKFIEPETGAKYIRPEDVLNVDEKAAFRLADWITDVANLAVNDPGLATRTITTGAFTGADVSHGNFLRLMFSNIFFAKSFGVTATINHTLPIFREIGQGRLGRAASTAIFGTLMGALAMQTRQIVSGKDPQAMNSVNFWMASMLQTGGLGIFGDFMFADQSRTNNSLTATLSGPIPMSLENILKIGDLHGLGTDIKKPENIPADIFRLINREIPLIHMWYSRMIVERVFLDQVEKATDPSYDKRMSGIEKRMMKQKNQGFWWKPGELKPERSPDLSTVGGQ